MKKQILFTTFIISSLFLHGQIISKNYSDLIVKANSLIEIKDYKNAAYTFSEAFKLNDWNARPEELFNSVCAWSLSNIPDSAFFYLNHYDTLLKYPFYEGIIKDLDLKPLYTDNRWNAILQTAQKNKSTADALQNKHLIEQLDTIFDNDQKYRIELHEIESKFGPNSKEIMAQWKIIQEKDSINLKQIEVILDKYGWLGSDVITPRGNSTLFLVIQHSNLETQVKYLPMMRQAAKDKKASSSELALLEDRVALRQGKRQIYGSQIGRDPETNQYFVSPLDDPDHVDERRAEVGLQPLAEYVSHWQIKWDAEQYKKELPAIELKAKKRKK